MCCVRDVSLKEECTISCIRGTCVGVVVGSAGLCAAVDGEPGCYEAVGLLFHENLTAHEDCIGFDGVSWEECEGFVGSEMFAEFFGDAGGDVGGVE